MDADYRANGTTKGKRRTVDIPGMPGMVDGRTREAKLYAQAVETITSDLGGMDHVTRAELELIRRAAGLSVLASMAEARLLAGEEVDVSQLTAVGNAQRRILATLGLDRRARDVTPSALQWIDQQAAQRAENDA